MIAEVIVDIASGETDRIYDYLCDDSVVVGSRVRAPFGGKTVPGFVMRLKQTSEVPFEKLKKVKPSKIKTSSFHQGRERRIPTFPALALLLCLKGVI